MFERLRQLRQRYGLRRGLPRELWLQYSRLFRRVSLRKLTQDLRDLGIRSGDVVFVHISFSRLGHVVGGPTTLIRALEAAVGPEGTLMMPAYSTGGLPYNWVIRSPVFDVRQTPSDVGVVPEVFRLQSSTIRSLHPTHSVCAKGRAASALIDGHRKAIRPFGVGTPFMRMAQFKGKGLLLGAQLRNFTTLRIIEDYMGDDYPIGVYCSEPYSIEVIDYSGTRATVQTLVPDPKWSRRRDGNLLLPGLKRLGDIREGSVGNAPTLLIDCSNLLTHLQELTLQGVLAYRL